MKPKNPVLSKTLWIQLLTFLAGVMALFNEQFQDMIVENPTLAGFMAVILSAINTLIRFITKEPLSKP